MPEADSTATIRLVGTMAALRMTDTSSLRDSFPVLLDGFAAANDGGGGVFVWRATSTEQDNGGTVVRPDPIPSSNPGRWVRLYSGAVNVRWFGAGVGAAVGGVSGALIGMGIPEYEAKRYEGRVRKGGILLSVHADDGDWTKRAKQVLERTGAQDIAAAGEVKGDFANGERPARR
jgi:hypothetical protein